MTDSDLLNKAIDILLHNGISSADLVYLQKKRAEFLSDISDDDRTLMGLIDNDAKGNINYILFYSNENDSCWNIRGLWVRPELRGKGIGTKLLSSVRKLSNNRDIIAFIPFNENRFGLAKLFLKCGYRHTSYISSISASVYNSIW